jgi:hypothetical protein
MVKAEHFHPMRGDVFDGQQIQFPDRVLMLRNVMRGWVLKDEAGNTVSETLAGAAEVTNAVYEMLKSYQVR